MLYVLALEHYFRKLKSNPLLREISLPAAITSARYSSYVDDIDEVAKEIKGYKTVTATKVNGDKSVGLRLGAWKVVSLPGPFLWTDGPVKIFGLWFGHDLLLEMNWSDVRERAVVAVHL